MPSAALRSRPPPVLRAVYGLPPGPPNVARAVLPTPAPGQELISQLASQKSPRPQRLSDASNRSGREQDPVLQEHDGNDLHKMEQAVVVEWPDDGHLQRGRLDGCGDQVQH